MSDTIDDGSAFELADTSPASVDTFIKNISAHISSDEDGRDWQMVIGRALAKLGDARDICWARLKLLGGGHNTRVSGPPLNVGRWSGLDTEAVAIARSQGTEDDYCSTLIVYEWLTKEEAESLVAHSSGWRIKSNISRALSVAAETMMYRHGAFDRACEILEMQLQLNREADGEDTTKSIVEQAKSLVRMTMARLAAGELTEAIATRERAKDMVDRLGAGFIIYEHAGTKSGGDLYPAISMESNFAWYIEGDWQAVADHWVFAIGLDEPGGSPVHIIEAAMAAQAFARLGQFEKADQMLRELTPVIKQLSPRDWALNGAVGRSSHAIWDMEAPEFAADYLELAQRLLAADVGDWTNTSLEQTVARMAALLGHRGRSQDYFGAARAKLSEKPIDPRAAIFDFDEAKAIRLLGANQPERRQELLSASRGVFRALKMNGWLARADAEDDLG